VYICVCVCRVCAAVMGKTFPKKFPYF